jgi:hypothetical protein
LTKLAASKGNKYAEGHGRPPIYSEDESEKVAELVDDYFEWIKGEYHEETVVVTEEDQDGSKNKVQKIIKVWDRNPEPPSVTGLTLHLNFSSKDTLYQYAKKPSFSDSIKKGLTKIEQYHEFKIGYGDKCTGNIFALKNMGWVDKTVQELKAEMQLSQIKGMTVE